MGKKFNVGAHVLVSKHVNLSEAEAKKLLDTYRITVKELPKILKTDPAIEELDVKAGDIIKIFRKSKVAGDIIYYRGVVNG